MASDIHAYAPDARIMTTYYSGDSPIGLFNSYNLFDLHFFSMCFYLPNLSIHATFFLEIGSKDILKVFCFCILDKPAFIYGCRGIYLEIKKPL